MNGWKNHATWNVTLWLANDETLYRLVRNSECWDDARFALRNAGFNETPDGVSYEDDDLDHDELTEFVKEL